MLLGMSLLDMSTSFALSFSTLPGSSILMEAKAAGIVKPGQWVLPTRGTVETCTAQGFLAHMGLGVPMYNASICFYYLLSIKYQIQDKTLMRWMIPFAHTFIFLWIFGTGIYAVVQKLFNFAGVLGCYLGKGARECQIDPRYCDRGQGSEDFELYFVLIPLGLCFAVVVSCMARIYFAVRAMETRTRRWDFANTSNQGSSSMSNLGRSSKGCRDWLCGANEGLPITKRTMESGALYSIAFLVVYVPIAISANVPRSVNPAIKKTIRILAVFFFPLQGLFNMLIYTSPVWSKWIKEKQICWCFGGCKRSRKSKMQDMRIPSDVLEEVNAAELELPMDFAAVKKEVEAELKKYNSRTGSRAIQEAIRELEDHETELPSEGKDRSDQGRIGGEATNRVPNSVRRRLIEDLEQQREGPEPVLQMEMEDDLSSSLGLPALSMEESVHVSPIEDIPPPSGESMQARLSSEGHSQGTEDNRSKSGRKRGIRQFMRAFEGKDGFPSPVSRASVSGTTISKSESGDAEGNKRVSGRRRRRRSEIRGTIRALERDIGIPLTSMNRSSASSYFNPSSVSYVSSNSNVSCAERKASTEALHRSIEEMDQSNQVSSDEEGKASRGNSEQSK